MHYVHVHDLIGNWGHICAIRVTCIWSNGVFGLMGYISICTGYMYVLLFGPHVVMWGWVIRVTIFIVMLN